jgi:hypothetical protein
VWTQLFVDGTLAPDTNLSHIPRDTWTHITLQFSATDRAISGNTILLMASKYATATAFGGRRKLQQASAASPGAVIITVVSLHSTPTMCHDVSILQVLMDLGGGALPQ